MILIKLLPLWLALTLSAATSPPERQRRQVFGLPDFLETTFKTARHNALWPKRSGGAEPTELPTYESCVCAEAEGFADLGEGHWPRVVPIRECGFAVNRASRLCKAVLASYDGRQYECKQRQYALRVLRRRETPVQDAQHQAMLPPELQFQWELVERLINSSCELQVKM